MEAQHTRGPWQVITEVIPHYLGEHTSRRIFTAWDHPQMQGPLPVVGVSTGVGPTKGGPCVQFCYISEDDAKLIATAPELLDLAKALREAIETDLIANTSDEDTVGVLLDFAVDAITRATAVTDNA